MFKSLLRFYSILFVAMVLVSPPSMIDAASNESGTFNQPLENVKITTSLEDNLITKADKLTFDVWAKDENDHKINASEMKVTNNGTSVPVNWDDTEKTSYTLNLEVGENHVTIIIQDSYILEYKITREFAEDGDVIGTYIFSLEAFTIGLGYLVEPIQVDIIKGDNSAHALDKIVTNSGFNYDHTGTLTNAFYLSYVLDGENQLYTSEPRIPQVLKEMLAGNFDETNYFPGELGEFDFNSFSGWMYAVNNVFPNVGFADFYLKDGDVMRVQYTIALGSDLGGGMGQNFFELVNKDELTKKIAEINSSGNKEEYLLVEPQKKAYDDALEILQKVNALQYEVDFALQHINLAEQR
ncbi:DUF4430 domain-containing protein [Pseudogracilibacillus auburnensis]|uniref:DUF4430 domain-containing protein n=1 Tax=Pseudogracilibacillus auburnensis TaxID=1494959 RepID=UPI001A9591CD|nr:DUF4430 domain-containing protein [Pseudogracilibacillus auburnensis]